MLWATLLSHSMSSEHFGELESVGAADELDRVRN